jgi:hypothetical protein
MIHDLMKQEKSIRSILWLPVGLAMGAFLLALHETPASGIPFLPRDFAPQYLFYPTLFFWAIISPYLLAFGATQRCSRYHMALPLRARDLWLSHMLSLAGSAFAILGVASAVLAIGSRLQGSPGLDAGMRALVINVAAFTVLALMLVQTLMPRMNEIKMDRRAIACILLIYLALLVLIPIAASREIHWVLLPLAAATLLGARIYRGLPSGFELVSGKAVIPSGESAAAPGRPAAAGVSRTSRAVHPAGPAETGPGEHRSFGPHRLVIRTLLNPVLTPVICIVLFIFGYRNAGYQDQGLSNMALAYWAFVAMSALVITSAHKLHLLDALPISRKLIFAYLVLPGLLVGLAGFSLGTLSGKGRASGTSLVEYEQRNFDRQLDVRVPLEFWELGNDGWPAPIEPCCDEPHGAWSVSLFRGGSTVLYNPYHAPADSSPDFVAHQFSRAVEAVYGRMIPISELKDRYFEAGPAGGTVLKTERFDLAKDFPGLRAVGWSRTLAATILLVGAPWLLYLALVMGGGYARMRIGHLILTVGGVAYLFTLIWTSSRGYTQEWKLSAAAGIIVRKSAEALPGSTLGLWMFAVAAVIACYMLARRRFARMEIMPVDVR